MNPRPIRSASQAVLMAMSLERQGMYKLGASDADAARLVFDCTSFSMRHCFGIPGHRPGYNRGWGVDWCNGETATCEDDINSNSAIEDAQHDRDLFEVASGPPRPGDIMAYPTIRLPGKAEPWVGHAAIVVGVDRARHNWDWARPDFSLLDMVECHGPNGTTPAIRRVPGMVFMAHNSSWPKPQHRSWLLRVRP